LCINSGDASLQWVRPIFKGLADWKVETGLIESIETEFREITTSAESRDLPELMAIASGVSVLQYV
jgi:hypothetical protein